MSELDGAALDRFRRWMGTAVLRRPLASIEAHPIGMGTQNTIFEVRADDFLGVVRMPPPGAPAGRDRGIKREWRVLRALAATTVPHPRAIALCDDQAVLGRTFLLTEMVRGWAPAVFTPWPPPYDQERTSRRDLATAVVDGLAALGQVEWADIGLRGFGRPDGFHDRQVDRWSDFLEAVRTRELPGLDEVTRWLRDRRPLDFRPGLMHGDPQFANVMFRVDAPQLAAIIDWEMATIGDPKLDLAWFLNTWPEDGCAPAPLGESALDLYDLDGMPDRSALCERYAATSGRQLDDLDYYVVLARWKFAVMLEANRARITDEAKRERVGHAATEMLRRAAELAASSTFGMPTRHTRSDR